MCWNLNKAKEGFSKESFALIEPKDTIWMKNIGTAPKFAKQRVELCGGGET